MLQSSTHLIPNSGPSTTYGMHPAKALGLLLSHTALIAPRRTTHAVGNCGDKVASDCQPGKNGCLDADVCSLTRVTKRVTTLHCPGRHQRCGNRLEKQRQTCVKAGNAGAEMDAECEDAGEEGKDCAEKRDQEQGVHGVGQVEVAFCTEESRRDPNGCVEVIGVWGVEWEGWHDGAAVRVAVVCVDTANAEEGPSAWVAGVGDAVRAALQKVDLVFWACFDGAREGN